MKSKRVDGHGISQTEDTSQMIPLDDSVDSPTPKRMKQSSAVIAQSSEMNGPSRGSPDVLQRSSLHGNHNVKSSRPKEGKGLHNQYHAGTSWKRLELSSKKELKTNSDPTRNVVETANSLSSPLKASKYRLPEDVMEEEEEDVHSVQAVQVQASSVVPLSDVTYQSFAVGGMSEGKLQSSSSGSTPGVSQTCTPLSSATNSLMSTPVSLSPKAALLRRLRHQYTSGVSPDTGESWEGIRTRALHEEVTNSTATIH